MPFDIPNLRVENGPATAHVRIGWLRSVANIYHAFAEQSFADELSYAAKRDPLDYLLELIGKPRILDLKDTKYRTMARRTTISHRYGAFAPGDRSSPPRRAAGESANSQKGPAWGSRRIAAS